MTRFWREGHFRMGLYGDEHWVEGHWVDRDDWERSGSPDTSAHWGLLQEMHADKGMTSAYVVPNAICPVCGKHVFFYSNEHGSRVYFDELGPPWPKHPCMDQPDIGRARVHEIQAPVIRSELEMDRIRRLRNTLGRFHFGSAYSTDYKTNFYYPWVALRRYKVKDGVMVPAMNLTDREKIVVFSLKSAKASLKRGVVIVPMRGKLSYFDTGAMEAVTAPCRRIGIKAFVHGILDPDVADADAQVHAGLP